LCEQLQVRRLRRNLPTIRRRPVLTSNKVVRPLLRRC